MSERLVRFIAFTQNTGQRAEGNTSQANCCLRAKLERIYNQAVREAYLEGIEGIQQE